MFIYIIMDDKATYSLICRSLLVKLQLYIVDKLYDGNKCLIQM